MKLRYFFLLALLPLAAAPALAGPRDDVMSAAARCAGISDNRAWLDCYYGAAQPMRSELGLPPAPASQTARVPPPPAAAARVTSVAPAPQPAVPPPRTGFLQGLLGGNSGLTTMASYSFDSHNRFTVTLANGETWQQLGDDTNIAHWREAASKYRVSVAEGYNHAELTVDNDGQIYHVRRAN